MRIFSCRKLPFLILFLAFAVFLFGQTPKDSETSSGKSLPDEKGILLDGKQSDDLNKEQTDKSNTEASGKEEKGLIELPQNDFFHSWHLFPIQIQSQKDWQKNHRKRTEMMQSLAKRGIGLSVHYKPLHMMSYYKTVGNYQPEDLPNTLDRYSRSFSLPIYPSLKKSQIRYIIKEIIRLIENGS